ncbi:glycine betaine/proline transport system permease protein [Methylobacterium sp. PvP062]|jgi:glycine betaine/proline transport system permease protein|uniref:Glycine betaine/proline transport system permease protein n=1 Tax=Methylobacterium radiotolerans TaxID=31998 RepID=A0ABV2NMT8_9HYPH|nr:MULTISPECIES: proline/glycine betaine ABC transporter permease [Methylobacterium]MCX7335694.1 proline/glycine betaine ABC transporter permease [Hyphomicrobiales bacterium]GAN51998.1 binding-protein-dependent transport system inner membrane protein [Methylobacterium sp. ME121]MBN6822137.1 proline/glycine betaine ABC transporter permease [Methylobacterium organophilum]MBP2495448.1 glycine betaine/proline transport system permease protein [Methylobacterium sp. PvP105]MBP2504681.1 glycine betai
MDWNVPKFPLDTLSDDGLDWLTDHGAWLTRAVSRSVSNGIDTLTAALISVPPWAVIAVAALATYKVGGRKVGLLTLAGLLFLWDLRLWQSTVETLVLVSLATVMALLIGIPLGIWFALSRWAWKVFSPVLDMMQTLPSFVYLIPALPFFGLGAVSACFATIIFSVPPVIRLTTLGIRNVPTELIEASDAFGGSATQKLLKVQLPLALPTIMAGVNQTMMLALSMVVIAAMIGAGGLGREVWQSIQRLEAGAGFEAGLGIVILAVILDRFTQALAARARPHGSA